MRASLKRIETKIDYIESNNLFQSVADIKVILQDLLEQIDKTLPKDVTDVDRGDCNG